MATIAAVVIAANDDQAGAHCIRKRICQPIAAEFVQLQHQVRNHQYDHADVADEIQ